MDVSVVITPEDRKALEHARQIVGALAEANLELDVFGCPPMPLVQDELDGLLSKVKAQMRETAETAAAPFGRVLHLHGGRIA